MEDKFVSGETPGSLGNSHTELPLGEEDDDFTGLLSCYTLMARTGIRVGCSAIFVLQMSTPSQESDSPQGERMILLRGSRKRTECFRCEVPTI